MYQIISVFNLGILISNVDCCNFWLFFLSDIPIITYLLKIFIYLIVEIVSDK